jgi:adenosylmethionine-8-amino-7-oxononanoate aminotransferase
VYKDALSPVQLKNPFGCLNSQVHRPMSRVFGRDTRIEFPVAVRGEGLFLYDSTGRRYLDASGGAAVSCLGHGHPAVREAIKQQVDRLGYAHTGYFTNEPQEALADDLIAHAPPALTRAYFVTGGSEATEAALKLARQYHVECGRPQRTRFISRKFSYHGNTLGALAVSGHTARRETYLPLLQKVTQISPCFAYRGRQTGETEATYGERVANELEAAIMEEGAESIAAFIAEPVVGATLGAVPAVSGYFQRIRQICDRHNVLLILDEVMCGMGRTGTLHACEQEGIEPDLLLLAKGLGAGYQPIGAMLVAEKIYEAIAKGSGAFNHGHTYMGHAVGCAAALAVQKVIRQDDLLSNVQRQGRALQDLLHERFQGHPHIGDIRGRGLLRAIELVEDRATKRPFASSLKLHARIKQQAMAQGLICYPGGGTADGESGDHVLIAPPFNVAHTQLEQIVLSLGTAVEAALRSLPNCNDQASDDRPP